MSADSPTSALLLNVDDDAASRYVKTRILSHAGFEVVEAATGEAGLRLVRERRPALVLLDVKLPDIGGREVCARIKADPALARTVVLQTSASHVETRHRVASLEAGADAYLVEPMEAEELVATVRALLRMRQAEDEREALLHALKEADRRKDEFLAMLAHELRNPLGPIRNAVEILGMSRDPKVHERARQLIGRQVRHLARLVDDLLEVSRITQRKVVLQTAVVPLASVIENALEVARPLIEAQRQVLEVSLPAEPLALKVDPVRMSQVIGNLLHNAAKFTQPGGTIGVRAELRPGGLAVTVSDNGLGMSPDVLPHVFELFAQGERSLDRSQGGLGIGLSLVKALVEMHDGEVQAQSEGVGRGSRFTVRLPAERVSRSEVADAPAAVAADSRPRRILVVEDNVDGADAMRMMLAEFGHEVVIANDGPAALAAAKRFAPEVILLDIGLPGMDGYELARVLRGMPEARSARLIAVTGYGQQRDRARSRDAGFDVHLVKPVDPAQLSEAINAVAA